MLPRLYRTHGELIDMIDEWVEEAENGNRHDFCAALNDLSRHALDLEVGDTFFGVVDFDALGEKRFALVEIIDA